MKRPRSRRALRRLTFASALGFASLSPALADLTLYYNFEDLTSVGDEGGDIGSEVINLGSTGVPGLIRNPSKVKLNNGPTIVTVDGVQYSLGKVLEFVSGESDTTSAGHIDTGLPPEELGMTNGPAWNRDYTAMAWVNFRSTTGDNMVFGQTAASDSLHLGSRNGYFHSGHWGDDIGPDQGINVATPVNSWHHVTWINEGQSQSIYLDGELIAGPGATGANTTNSGFNVVIATFTNGGSFVGALDEVKIFGDQVLTPEEIKAEMIANLPVYNLAAVSHYELTADSYIILLEDTVTSQVNAGTVTLEIDGASVTPTITKEGSITTIIYTPPTPPLPATTHEFRVTATDQNNSTVVGSGNVRMRYLPTHIPGPSGTVGRWGVREYRPASGFPASELGAVVRELITLPETDDDLEDNTIIDATGVPVINHCDPDSAGSKGNFNNDLPFIGNIIAVDDNNVALVAKTQIEITDISQDYTFSVHSDDGFGLRISGGPPGNNGRFIANYGGGSIDESDPQTLLHVATTSDSNTRGVYRFTAPGTYDVTFVAYEIGGGAFWEVAWAPGHHRFDRDSSWELLGTPNDPQVTAVPFEPKWPAEFPGPLGGNGTWGIRTYLEADSVSNLTQTIEFLMGTARTPEDGDGLTIDEQRNFLNAHDPSAAGPAGYIPNDEPFPGYSGSAQDRVVTVAKGRIQVVDPGTYTFSVRSDDGFLLRFKGVDVPNPAFKRVTRNNAADGNGRFEMSNPHELFYEADSADTHTRGIIDLAAGFYDVEFVHWEGEGGFSYELAFAKGEFPHETEPPFWMPVGYAGGGVVNSITIDNPGWTVESSVPLTVNDENPAPDWWRTAEAEAMIDETLADPSAPSGKVSVWNAINFNDPQSGGPGSIPGDVPWPLNTPADDNYFAMRATATFTIDQEGDYVFGFEGDDGGYLQISGVGGTPDPSFDEELLEAANSASFVDSGPGSTALNRLVTDIPTGNSRTVGKVHLVPGTYQIKALMFENAGGAYWEIFGGDRVARYVSYPLITTGPTQSVPIPQGLRLVDPRTTPAAELKVINFTFNAATGEFSLTFESEPETTYVLEYSVGLQPAGQTTSPTTWNTAPGNLSQIPSSGTSTTITGNISAFLSTNGGQLPDGSVCFFRVRAL